MYVCYTKIWWCLSSWQKLRGRGPEVLGVRRSYLTLMIIFTAFKEIEMGGKEITLMIIFTAIKEIEMGGKEITLMIIFTAIKEIEMGGKEITLTLIGIWV